MKLLSASGGFNSGIDPDTWEGREGMDDRLVWIDLEMSGLDPDRHVIVEIATIVTDGQLGILAEGPDIAVRHSEDVLALMEDWSREHHQSSGLMDRIRASACDCAEAERQTIDFLSLYCEEGKSPLCGNSVWQDRRFLVKYMPRLEAFLHYRIIDVSTVKELVKRWYPSLAPFKKEKPHLAMGDIKESIHEMAYYRDRVFV